MSQTTFRDMVVKADPQWPKRSQTQPAYEFGGRKFVTRERPGETYPQAVTP